METRLTFVHALSPLHAGTGQGVGVIDLPIARETATKLPYLPGSSLRGVLRHTLDGPTTEKIFGKLTSSGTEPGLVHIADQRLLLLPVRSIAGIFAWVTSPYVLRRFARDVQDNGMLDDLPSSMPNVTGNQVAVRENSVLTVNNKQQVYLEDLDLVPSPSEAALANEWATWIERKAGLDRLAERFAIVPDDVLSFLLTTATEVVARVRLEDEKKTVASGALWYEEALPAETVLSGLVLHTGKNGTAKDDFTKLKGFVAKPIHLGGNTGVGRGLCRVVIVD
ncbi:MAG: type III-B CRISPR module RAMP protein Cmr4 [Chloroflexaceae bacterium]|nr:type III-B CRISPR module RAMP protein Cmr4 [Chloroflexaceae bacterium]